ncbi:MAG: amidase [Planctomycetes bacterium]|nr:amidase [Planctomycetota bacterium]
MNTIRVEQSGAFVERFSIPPTGDGVLNGLRFAVKDLVDVAGRRTGCGNPTRLETNPPAVVSAVCVDQLLAAGAQCEGKTVTDELAFSLLGINHFYGTPLNPAAPERVPGGSSSGSASAVACGLVDFAIGTDTGGSVRVPASNCGIWGWRPTYGVVSVAGVMPLAPMFDTVGILARSADVLRRAAAVLLADAKPQAAATPATIHVVSEAFDTADAEVRDALRPAVEFVERVFDIRVQRTSLDELCGDVSAADWNSWRDMYRRLVGAEALSCHGAWLASERPPLGPITESGFKHAESLDRSRLAEVIGRRERYCRHLRRALGPRDLLCLPTAPSVAPLKDMVSLDRNSDYYRLTVAFNAIAGVGRLPQVSMPLATASSAPIGLSLIGAYGEDALLLYAVDRIENSRSSG